MERKVGKRQIKQPRTWAIGAGITEYWYLKHLKKFLGLNVDLHPRLFGNESMQHLKKLIDEGLEYGVDVVCLFDEDVKQWNKVESTRNAELHKEYDKNTHVILGSSMPSIEYWFLLHFENTNRYMRTSKEASKSLQKYISGYDKKKDFLSREKWVYDLLKENKMEMAVRRAQNLAKFEARSYTNVWKAIKKMTL